MLVFLLTIPMKISCLPKNGFCVCAHLYVWRITALMIQAASIRQKTEKILEQNHRQNGSPARRLPGTNVISYILLHFSYEIQILTYISLVHSTPSSCISAPSTSKTVSSFFAVGLAVRVLITSVFAKRSSD